jgi:preprotein translocase subunit SecG
MKLVLSLAQLVLSILLIIVILLQQKGAGLGAAFGGSGMVHATRRGVDKVLFNATIVITVAFLLISLAAVLVK